MRFSSSLGCPFLVLWQYILISQCTDLDPLCLDIQGDEGDEPLAEQLANDLAHPPKASNDDMVPHLLAGTLIWLHCLQCGSNDPFSNCTQHSQSLLIQPVLIS